MPNTNRPDDTRCPADAYTVECRASRPGQTAGVCPVCELGTCALCGGPMTPEQCVDSKKRTTGTIGDEVYCPACLPEVLADGVPVAVDEESSGAKTVRLEADPSIAETGADWADKLDAAVAL